MVKLFPIVTGITFFIFILIFCAAKGNTNDELKTDLMAASVRGSTAGRSDVRDFHPAILLAERIARIEQRAFTHADGVQAATFDPKPRRQVVLHCPRPLLRKMKVEALRARRIGMSGDLERIGRQGIGSQSHAQLIEH